MPTQTDLSTFPHYDDFDENKNYHKILFQPGVAVQTRELNQLQTMLQNQIEKFGDNILKKGTIIDGCNVTFWPKLPYIKIRDLATDGTPVNVDQLSGYYLRNSSGLESRISIVENGLESSTPDLKTLFINYTNSGNTFGSTVEDSRYAADQVLTVFDPVNPVFKYVVENGSSGFSNSDVIVVTGSMALQNSSGGKIITVGARPIQATDIIKSDGLAIGQIVEVDTTSNTTSTIVRVKPLSENLKVGDSKLWTFYENSAVEISIFGTTTKSTANKITKIYGSGAYGSLLTDSLGKVVSVSPVNLGAGYDYLPYVSVSSPNAALSEISQFVCTPQTFLTNISVAGNAFNPVGYGYGMNVDKGVIYQKGYFTKVAEQLVVVEKYTNTGFDKSVGFITNESIIDSNQDTSLLDNATGEPNFTAPGAKRLKLVPSLTVLDKAEAELDSEFFPIVEFSDGSPYRQSKQTVYNVIGDIIAQRTFEESGNYVLDKFNIVTKDVTANTAKLATSFNVHIDPGVAYINGYRVKTDANFVAEVTKGTDTNTKSNVSTVLYYGDYFRVNELAGQFKFDIGDLVEFYDAPSLYISTSTPGTTAISATGNKIGTARVRSIVLESGYAGTPSAIYRVYTFDRIFSVGKSASNIRAIYHPGQSPGICDIVQENSTTILYDNGYSTQLFMTGVATAATSNTTFYYKAANPFNIGSNGTLSISVEDPLSESFDVFSENTIAENDVVITPTDNFQISANLGGTVTTQIASPVIVGTSTTFLTDLTIGDFVIINANTSLVFQVTGTANNTNLTVNKNVGSALAGTSIRRYFPRNIPISLSTPNSSRTAKIQSGQLVINLGIPGGMNLANTTGGTYTPPVVVSYNVKKKFSPPVSKGTTRNTIARIKTSNNSAGIVGPWSLGVSDVFRLNKVYKANGAPQTLTFSTNANSIDETNEFIRLTNHPFANGDTVTYTTSIGNTAVTGLSNNSVYKVLSANSSGIKLANNSTDAIINISTDFQNGVHNLTGSPLYFDPSSNGVEDVTNGYYIDNNQTPDYLDTSYLFRKQTTTSTSNNDVLLVMFDAFTPSTSEGLKTISSYNIDDVHKLSEIASNSVNTMEIPELFDNATGKYYDLRDQFDFRPASANTISLLVASNTNYSNTSIINPIEPIDGVVATVSFNAATAVNGTTEVITIASNPFVVGDIVKYYTGSGVTGILANNSNYYIKTVSTNDITLATFASGPTGATVNLTAGTGTNHFLEKTMLRFSGNKKYFPVPGSLCTSDITTYLGRTDRVVVTTTNKFDVVKGIPGKIDEAPPEPDNGLTLNLVKVPPYPSLPQILSSEMAEIVDTKVLNQREGQRKNYFKINTLLSSNEQNLIQVKPYRMEDIATLERRIKNLEYYVTITLVETIARSRFIGSSVNSSLDRFKFGIFVDSFVDYAFSETSDPEYNANIINDKLIPKGSQLNLEMIYDAESDGVVGSSLASFPFTEYTLINQADATIDPEDEPPVFDELITETSITQITSTSYGQYRSANRSNNNKDVWEDWSYTFSSLPGSARFYINARDQRVQIEVFQGTTPNFIPTTPIVTSLSWEHWTATDKGVGGEAYDVGKSGTVEAGNWSNYPWVEDAFKLNWTHNPANGLYYIIRVYKGKHLGSGLFGLQRQSPKGFYAFKLYYPSDTITTTTRRYVGRTAFEYAGRVYSMTPDTFTLSQSIQYGDFGSYLDYQPYFGSGYIADSQRFDMSIIGLRPLTRHTFNFEGEDVTSKCVQIRTDESAGLSGLISDANGMLNFSYYYDAGITETTSDFEQQNKLAASIAGRKTLNITNVDGTSKATGNIELKYYANIANETPVYPVFVNSTTVTGNNTGNNYENLSNFDSVVSAGGGGARDASVGRLMKER